jgi:hypothetical protein
MVMIKRTSQSVEGVSEEISALGRQQIKLTRSQVSEAVIEAMTLLESKAIALNEVLDVMSNLAFQQGNNHLGQLLSQSSQVAWEVDCIGNRM